MMADRLSHSTVEVKQMETGSEQQQCIDVLMKDISYLLSYMEVGRVTAVFKVSGELVRPVDVTRLTSISYFLQYDSILHSKFRTSLKSGWSEFGSNRVRNQ